MTKHALTAAVALSVLGAAGMSVPAFAKGENEPKGNAYGYWTGRLCDHVGPTTNGVTYWESRGYEDREACMEAEGESLRAGEWDPDELDPITYPI
jgi:hypothetical protein